MKAKIDLLPTKVKKAMEEEIQRQISESTRKHNRHLVEILLVAVMDASPNISKKKLIEIGKRIMVGLNELADYYELPDEDREWLADRILRERGITEEDIFDGENSVYGYDRFARKNRIIGGTK